MAFFLILIAAAVVIVIVAAPFRRDAGGARPALALPGGRDGDRARDRRVQSRVADLEAAREAKYREIRDAELDHRTGKLSDEDFRLLDGTLRAEAITILQALDRAREGRGATIDA